MVQTFTQIEICEKQADSKGNNAESSDSNKHGESTKQPTESNPFSAILDGLARNKPILDVLSVTCLILILAMFGVIVCLVVLYGKSSPKTSTSDYHTDETPVRIITRNEWLAQPPRERLELLQQPVHKIIIAHTATEECTTKPECASTVGRIQQFHMAPDSKNFDDISFNFLVGADGNIYEGRGWDNQGAHTKGFNRDSICIAFIGTFTDIEAPVRQLSAAQQLIALGVELGKVDKRYELYGHRQLAPFESPGRKLYEVIKMWPHWSKKFPSQWEDKVTAVNGSAGTS